MARIKNGITKSGASLLSERTQAIKLDIYNQQMNQPYIPNGTNVDKLSIVKKYNDQNTINFDNLKYSTPQAYFSQHPNERSILDEITATPSTMPDDLGLGIDHPNFYNNFPNNQSQIIDKFLKKVNSVQLNYTPFKDTAYTLPTNSTIQYIKGEGKFYFLNTNLYEETSIDIELDVPADALLEYTAKMQEFDNTNPFTFDFSTWDNSPYSFRRNSDNGHIRTNSPFLMYNFAQNCFESRGWSRFINFAWEGNEILTIPNVNFTVDDGTIKINNTDFNNSNLKYQTFKTNLNSNLKNHNFALSHTPIQDLNTAKAPGSDQVGNYFSIPSMQFGFPHFPTFHTFDDNLLSMHQYLNKPLIIDRVTVELDVKLKSEISTDQNLEDLYIDQGLNFSLNYTILNSPKNYKNTQSKLKLLISNPFQLKKDITQTGTSSETFNKTTPPFTLNAWRTFLQTHASPTLISPNYFASTQQNSLVKRKILKDVMSVITTDMSSYINFNTNIVSFGNVVFHAPHPNNIESGKTYKQTHLTELSQLINNNTLLIDTFSTNSFNLDMLSQDKIFLDYDGKVKINDYVKKAGNLSLDFCANNINHQFEFFSNTSSTLQNTIDIFKENNIDVITVNTNDTLNVTRNLINDTIDGKDVVNTFSFLDFDKKDHGIIPAPIFRKTSPTLFNNVFPGNSDANSEYYQKNVEGKIQTGFYKKPSQEFSPYVLTPDDNLAFCFSISPTIAPKLFKHSCQIKSGKVKFTLHGYMKKNNEKFQDDTNLKNLNQQNLSSTIVGNNSIINDDYSNLGYLAEYINTFNDRIFQGELKLSDIEQDQRKLHVTTPSKILSGKSYIPYTKLEPKNDIKWIYDNDVIFSEILRQLLITDNQNPDINSYLTSYRGTIDENDYTDDTDIPPGVNPLETDFDRGEIEYFDFNIAAAITPFKLDFKSLKGPIAQIQNVYETQINDLINSIPIFGIIFAMLFILDKLSTGGFINRRHNFSSYYNNRKYGQFIDMFQQRLFTTEMSRDVNNIPVVEYVLEQKFINNINGVELTNLSNPLIPRNKSKNLQLIDSGFKSITPEGVITPWDVSDFFNLKHVAYNDEDTSVFL